MKFLTINKYLLLFVATVSVFFAPFFVQGKLPLPADALVGLYHPWRDAFSGQYPYGLPYKNPLITDPVRQQYPYRLLAIAQLKQGKLPNWNPYSFSGTPLLANIQTAAFYPFNALFWVFTDEIAWSLLVFLQPLLAGIFLYIYLRSLNLGDRACFLGAVTFAFSGFMVSWLEWNTIGHVALWLPLILLAKDKLVDKFSLSWAAVLVFSETAMILAGHLQIALYVLAFTSVYLVMRILNAIPSSPFRLSTFGKKICPFILTGITVLLLTLIQWLPTFQFILVSARQFDLPDWHRPDWFIPWWHPVQFVAPDFFGNPATGNYWGVWNYGEFVGYVGLIPLILAVFALIYRRNKRTLFFGTMFLASLFLGLPTFIGKLPYMLNTPFLSTLQPSRILVLIDFSLAVLAAFGWDFFQKMRPAKKIRLHPMINVTTVFVLILSAMWVVVVFANSFGFSPETVQRLAIAKKNLLLPSVILIMWSGFLFVKSKIHDTSIFRIVEVIVLIIIVGDLLRFGMKFTPFTDTGLLYPRTATIDFLQANLGAYRLMTTDRRIMPPNVSTLYKLQSVDGYDPLYLKSYGEFVAAWTRVVPDITPASFNRILTPEKTDAFFTNLLGVKYILSLKNEIDPKLRLVFQEGETRVYENTDVFPRAFLVGEIRFLSTPGEVMQEMFAHQNQLRLVAYTDKKLYIRPVPLTNRDTAEVLTYATDRVAVWVSAEVERVLILTDIYHPDWKVFVGGKESTIFPVDFALRGVVVPRGESLVEFRI